MFYHFEFESEFYPTLERIPFHVRMKLDTTGVKLSLDTWRAFSLEERRVLCHLPTETEEERSVFISYMAWLSRTRANAEIERTPVLDSSSWGADTVPEAVERRGKGGVTASEWNRWAEHERYALYKTAMSRDPELFEQALSELKKRRA
jgi:hypothetical protein